MYVDLIPLITLHFRHQQIQGGVGFRPNLAVGPYKLTQDTSSMTSTRSVAHASNVQQLVPPQQLVTGDQDIQQQHQQSLLSQQLHQQQQQHVVGSAATSVNPVRTNMRQDLTPNPHAASYSLPQPIQLAKTVTQQPAVLPHQHLDIQTGHSAAQSKLPVTTTVSKEDLQKIRSEVKASILKQISEDELKNLHSEAQAAILKQLTPEQIKNINEQAEAAIMQRIQEEKYQEFLAQQHSVMQAQGGQIQNISHRVSGEKQQQSSISDDQVAKITIEKHDGSRKEFFVHQDHGAQVFSFCQQVDISGGSQHSGSMMLAPSAVQPFPAHTIRNVEVSQLQQYNRSLHSDTSSSLGSGAQSFHSASSILEPSAFTASGSTR